MRRKLLTVFLVLLTGATVARGGVDTKVDDAVWTSLQGGSGEFLVRFVEQTDVGGSVFVPGRGDRSREVVAALMATAARSQAPVVARLAAAGVPYRRFWIANLIWVRGDARLVRELAGRDDVDRILANPRVPRFEDGVGAADRGGDTRTVEWNLVQIGAPAVWATGNTGQGGVIGVIDTGVDWDHPALIRQYRGWDGTAVHHDGNWHDATAAHAAAPVDGDGHGTRTAGVGVGDDGAGTQIGVAPGARWIAARCLDGGWATPAMFIESLEWMTAPYPVGGTPDQGDPALAPDVVLTCWSCIPGHGCAWDTLLPVVANVRAAGICVVAIAGGSGPSCSTIQYPPEIYDESFTVATTGDADAIATFSSRGPVTVDGSGRLKPDVCAPGVNVRSAATGGGYVETSGASVAAPHVAGLIALLVTANPGLHRQVGALEELIAGTAVPRLSSQCGGTGVPNNVYGHGRIDAAAACGAATTGLVIPDAATVTLSCAPNPWNPRATFRLFLPSAGHVVLGVYDVAGREVAHLVDGTLASGTHEVVWDGTAASASLPSGTYLCRLATPWGIRTTKLQLVR